MLVTFFQQSRGNTALNSGTVSAIFYLSIILKGELSAQHRRARVLLLHLWLTFGIIHLWNAMQQQVWNTGLVLPANIGGVSAQMKSMLEPKSHRRHFLGPLNWSGMSTVILAI